MENNSSSNQPARSTDGIELRKQILILLLVAGIFPLLVLLVFSYYQLGEMEDEAYRRMGDMATIAHERLEDETSQLSRQIRAVSKHEHFYKRDGEAAGQKNGGLIMENVRGYWKLFAKTQEDLMLLDTDGRTISSTKEETTTYHTPSFHKAKNGKEFVDTRCWTSPQRGEDDGDAEGLSTILYYPLRASLEKDAEVQTVVRLRVFMSELVRKFGDEGTMHYVSSNGFLLAEIGGEQNSEGEEDEASEGAEKRSEGGKEASDDKLLNDFATRFQEWSPEEEQGVCRENNVEYLYRNMPFNMDIIGEGNIVYMLRTEKAMAFGKSLYQTFFLVGCGAILLLFWLGFLYAGRLARPIQAAARAAGEVAHGNLGIRLRLAGPRELRHLASSFNTMTEEVRSNREEMERKIQERTKRVKEISMYTTGILDCMSEALVVVGDGRIHLINKSATTLLGVDGAQTPMAEVHERMRGLFEKTARWDRFRESVERSGQDGMMLLSPSAPSTGDINWLEVHTTPVPGPHEGDKARLWLLRDVSVRERLQSELRQIQRQEAIGLLAGGIAHEFNNILTSIQGGLELAKWDSAEGIDPTGSIDSGLTACHRASDIVQRLLGFARKQEDMEMKPTQLNEVIRESLDLVEARLDPLIRIERGFDDRLELVEADSGQLVQVLVNLVINASHAMEEDGGRIAIRSFMHEGAVIGSQAREASSGPYCAIEVEDNGSGMEASVVERMYDPFFTTKPPGQGTGLGLAICHQIVRSHQGWIACESTPGKGTKFTLYFPTLSNPGRIAPAETDCDVTHELRATTNGRILVVDDEPHIRKIAERYLSRIGHSVEEMPDGIEAIKRLESGAHFDLVILDLHMPIISGEETLHRIKTKWPNLPVIIWTGGLKDAPRIYDAPPELQPDAFLEKPFGSKDLVKLVNETLHLGSDNVPPPIPFPSGGNTLKAEDDDVSESPFVGETV